MPLLSSGALVMPSTVKLPGAVSAGIGREDVEEEEGVVLTGGMLSWMVELVISSCLAVSCWISLCRRRRRRRRRDVAVGSDMAIEGPRSARAAATMALVFSLRVTKIVPTFSPSS